MRIARRTLALVLSILIIAPAADAQNHVVTRAALDSAVQQRVAEERADREAIVALLRRPEVREIAARAGLSLDKAEVASSALQGTELREIATQARHVNNELAGGASTITISTTTIIIVLLIIILIVVIAD